MIKKFITTILIAIMFFSTSFCTGELDLVESHVENIYMAFEEQMYKEEQERFKVQAHDMVQDADVVLLCKMLWGESRGLSEEEQRATIEVALNMVDMRGTSISGTVTPGRFTGLKHITSKSNWQQFEPLVRDELYNYYLAQLTNDESYRVIPSSYYYWMGDGHKNYFCNVYHYGSLEIAKANAWQF